MTLKDRLAEIKDDGAIIGIIYKDFRALDYKKNMDEMLEGKFKELNLTEKEIDYDSSGSAYGQQVQTVVVSLKDLEEKTSTEETTTPETHSDTTEEKSE